MAILRVAQMGHPVLRMVAEPVPIESIPTPAFQQFCEDMLETMHEYDGAGLAAPQVYTSLRVVVADLETGNGPEFLINPEIEVLTDEHSGMMEGCLSIEGLRGRVYRPNHIRLSFYNRAAERVEYELTGFSATVTQHECDHLDGVLFVDRCDTGTLAFLREYRRWGPLDELGQDNDEHEEEAEDLDEIENLEEPTEIGFEPLDDEVEA